MYRSPRKPNRFIELYVPVVAIGTRIPDPIFSSFGSSRDYGMDLSLEVYL